MFDGAGIIMAANDEHDMHPTFAILSLTIMGWVPIANPGFPVLVFITPETWFDKLAEFQELGWYLPFIEERWT